MPLAWDRFKLRIERKPGKGIPVVDREFGTVAHPHGLRARWFCTYPDFTTKTVVELEPSEHWTEHECPVEPKTLIIMHPRDIQTIGQELAIKWEDGREDYLTLEQFRRACPCAGCKGESDIMGNLYKGPEQSLTSRSFELRSLNRVGTYAIQPVWGDGHNTGLYSYEYLEQIARRSPGA